jgi:Ni,Fe-hydrogenase maturation factor
MKNKILCLGNEFIEEDSFALKVAGELTTELPNIQFLNVKDSFQLMEFLNVYDNVTVLDVVSGLKDVKIIGIDELSENKIMTAHDFDAGFVMRLFENKSLKIIGIPMKGNIVNIKENVKKLIKSPPK